MAWLHAGRLQEAGVWFYFEGVNLLEGKAFGLSEEVLPLVDAALLGSLDGVSKLGSFPA